MLKHEVTAERYRELTRDKIEKYVERGNRELCSNELIELIDEFIERKCDNPFIVGGDCDGGRGPFPEHDKKALGREQMQIIERDTERLAKRTRDRYEWSATDEKWHFVRQDVELTSYDRDYEIIYLKCGTASEIRKTPLKPLGSNECQFRINGGPWVGFPRPIKELREFLPTVTAGEIEGGLEKSMSRLVPKAQRGSNGK